jgi:glutathionyl-hydroquinone reductase
MGLLVEGQWRSDADTKETGTSGEFVRKPSSFRNWITPDGAAGPSGIGGFEAEPNRYHLYVSYACPWAHRALIYRKILKLESAISVSVVHPVNIVEGWEFSEFPGATADAVNGAKYLHEIYTKADPAYTGKVLVPVLWDKKTATIVNNESSEIIRMFGSNSRQLGGIESNLYPQSASAEIDAVNEIVYMANNGVYRTGFAKTQDAYEEAATKLFGALETLEGRLERSAYLVGDDITESDWRLFTTALRFDPVYYVHFKCSLKRFIDFPNLSRHLKVLREYPGVDATIRMDHIRHHYFRSQLRINPYGIIPVGPIMDWEAEG